MALPVSRLSAPCVILSCFLAAVKPGGTAPASRLRFDTYPLSHRFPDKRRNHANEYESYAVSGLLSAGWLSKHHSRLPATLVLVLRLPEDCPDWPAAEAGFVAAVAQARPATTHGAEIMVVVAGSAGAPPPAAATQGSGCVSEVLALRVPLCRPTRPLAPPACPGTHRQPAPRPST